MVWRIISGVPRIESSGDSFCQYLDMPRFIIKDFICYAVVVSGSSAKVLMNVN